MKKKDRPQLGRGNFDRRLRGFKEGMESLGFSCNLMQRISPRTMRLSVIAKEDKKRCYKVLCKKYLKHQLAKSGLRFITSPRKWYICETYTKGYPGCKFRRYKRKSFVVEVIR